MNDDLKQYYNEAYTIKNVRKDPSKSMQWLAKKLQKHSTPQDQILLKLITPGDRLLDLGCGSGGFAVKAKGKYQKVYGVDISDQAIKQAAEKVSGVVGFEFMVHDADFGLPFNDSFFDSVVCDAVLEHMPYPPALLKEIYRVLKPQGELVLLVPNDAWIFYRLQALTGKIPMSGAVNEMGVDWGHLHKFNKKILCDLLTSLGFRVETVACSGVFAGWRKIWFTGLAGDLIVKGNKIERSTSS
jgi:SAM-dependent methyltransferase